MSGCVCMCVFKFIEVLNCVFTCQRKVIVMLVAVFFVREFVFRYLWSFFEKLSENIDLFWENLILCLNFMEFIGSLVEFNLKFVQDVLECLSKY